MAVRIESCPPAWTRRRFLSAVGAGAAFAVTARGGGSRAAPGMVDYPFALGVASGEPSADGFVIWTRIITSVQAAERRPFDLVVDWEIAEDEAMTRVVRRGHAVAQAEWAHSVHVDVDGLRADRWYWYRFICAGIASTIGRSRTLPAAMTPMQRLRLAVASCQHYEHGWFSAYRHMLADDLDLVIHVGDYIYEGSWGPQLRRHEAPIGTVTLDEYRDRHACYKGDRDLQAAHAAYPWLLTWDDHEVSNDYAGESLRDSDPAAFAARRAAAYRAWFEHMPVRTWRRPHGDALPVQGHHGFGDLASIHVLDARQYRAPQACVEQGEMIREDCAQRHATEQSMLGSPQRQWLFEGLAESQARWNILAQQTLLAPFVSTHSQGERRVWSDGWDGYAGERAALLDWIDDRNVANVVVLGGDMHAHYVSDLKRDFDDEDAPVIATEFVGTSITSQGPDQASVERDLPLNPHVRLFDGRYRGYLRCELTPQRWQTDLRIIDDAGRADTSVRTLASFDVENGRPGVQR